MDCFVDSLLGTFDEDALYANLDWLAGAQARIEERLFAQRQKTKPASLFLYDVTRSYVEATQNALAAFGDNRDGQTREAPECHRLTLRRGLPCGLYPMLSRQ